MVGASARQLRRRAVAPLLPPAHEHGDAKTSGDGPAQVVESEPEEVAAIADVAEGGVVGLHVAAVECLVLGGQVGHCPIDSDELDEDHRQEDPDAPSEPAPVGPAVADGRADAVERDSH